MKVKTYLKRKNEKTFWLRLKRYREWWCMENILKPTAQKVANEIKRSLALNILDTLYKFKF